MKKLAISFVRRAAAHAAVVLGLGLAGAAQAQTVLPPVVVTAPTTSGTNVICSGEGCAMMLQAMQSQAFFELHDYMPPIGEEGDTPINRTEFCNNLRGSKPSGCGSTSPPVPLVNISLAAYASTYGNGCGDGSWSGGIVDFIAGLLVEDYSGDPNEPMPGIHFQGACNNHDACYAGQGDRGGCDAAFYTELSGLCNLQSGAVRDTCNGFAHAYSGAVGLGGQNAYNQAGQAYQCALWHNNMENNACPK